MNLQAVHSGKTLEPRTGSSAARGARRMVLFALIAIVVLMGVAAWGLREAVFARGMEDAQRGARIVEEHAEKVIGGHLAELKQIEWLVGESLDSGARSGRLLHDRLKAVADAHREVESVWLVDRHGETWATSVSYPPPTLNQRERGYFRAAERGEEHHIGQVIFGRITHHYVFQISKRLRNEAGEFLGVAFASLDPGSFREFYRSIGPAADSIMLLRQDGALLVRSPQPSGDPTGVVAAPQFMALFSAQSGTFRAQGSFDAHDFIYAYRRVRDLPIYAVYGVQVDRIAGEWLQRVLSYLLFAGPALLALGVVGHVVHRQALEVDRASLGLREANLLLEQRVAERTKDLRESEARLRLGAEIGRFGTYEWDIARDEHAWSPETYAIFGLPPTAAIKADLVFGMTHPEDRGRLDAAIAADLQRPEPGASSLEYRIVRPDGEVRWIHVSARTTVSGSGERRRPERVIGAIQDITERRETEARLRAAQAELQHVWRVTDMGQMATTLAHELNQPLASIANYVGGAQMLLRGITVESPHLTKIREVMALARNEAVRAGQIIRRLREFIGRGDAERRIEAVDRLVEDALALALTGAQERGIRHRIVVEATDKVLVDRIQIQQVLVNLVRNAIEAMETCSRKELEVRVTRVEGMVHFSVSDTGTGLAPEIAGRLFEPFSSTKKQGMGIGLSVSHGIVEDHGGRIWAEPNPGGGTVFCFTIPVLHRENHHDRAG